MESLETINQQLVDLFGLDTVSGQPMWRVVFSDDQFEKRLMDRTDSGVELLTPEVREVPKYRQWIQHKYVLEHLVGIPIVNMPELPTSKTSYEPKFVFQDKFENPLPPKIEVCKIVIDTIYAAQGKPVDFAKYKEDYEGEKRKRLDAIKQELFGDETDVTDALTYKEGVVVPSKFFGD